MTFENNEVSSSEIELESDSFDTNNIPIALQKDNYDLDFAFAMSKSLESRETNILKPKEVEKLYAHQLDLLIKF